MTFGAGLMLSDFNVDPCWKRSGGVESQTLWHNEQNHVSSFSDQAGHPLHSNARSKFLNSGFKVLGRESF